ncbi:MAG TPA: alpha/beta hydrolase [Anaerolineales bacterium]|nr:alpha/beta hydrolase [Anaerolineales bacterium]
MSTVPTLPGIESRMIQTERINMHVLLSGPQNGIPVVFVHGNFSAATYWEETMLAQPSAYRCIAPDLRGYGDTQDLLVDGTRGARDWSDDLKAVSDVFGDKPAHLVGWSLGAAVLMQFALDYPQLVSSLTFVSPVSPYGFGGTKGTEGASCYPDNAGSGGGVVNPEFVRRIKEGDRSADDPNSPRNVINTFYYKAPFRASREEEFLSAALLEKMGDDRYPGDMSPSQNWPNVAPGKWGPINATSPKYFNTSAIAEMPSKPPILWVRGDTDQIVSDNSLFDFGTLGMMELVPGWPGMEVYPPQPMVSQMRAVLEGYRAKGGTYQEVVVADAAHSPHIEKPVEFMAAFQAFLESV